ncbi:hypothetical protein [Nitrolancea hollandica]|uniref:SprT-like domain-containing protein n=1 Tax=Nitrolancea hollandica Lb TaxID=1129897 RepID=I4EFL7_9BACT|nr:hypothetical protein [Nitrolancea hollandica]CCF83479.1 conserved hypothetical protein [Nitrolancea hollandica Lb]
MTDRDLEDRLWYWQRKLRLQDWDIKIRFVTRKEMDGKDGQVNYHSHIKRARIDILHPDEERPGAVEPLDIENTIVHELLHIHLSYFTEPYDYGSPGHLLEEQFIHVLAGVLTQKEGNETHE